MVSTFSRSPAGLVVRPLDAADHEPVRRLHERLNEYDTYMRFFTVCPAHLAALAAAEIEFALVVDDEYRIGVHGWTSSESEDRSANTFPTMVRETHTAYVAKVGHSDLIDLPADLPAATDVT